MSLRSNLRRKGAYAKLAGRIENRLRLRRSRRRLRGQGEVEAFPAVRSDPVERKLDRGTVGEVRRR